MADWPLRGEGQRFETAGADTSDSAATQITTSGTANTKGSYTEIIASTGFDASAFLWFTEGKITSESYLLDLALGAAGSEQVLVADFPSKSRSDTSFELFTSGFELPIPEGSRIAVRGQSVSASSTLDTSIILLGQSFLASSPFGRIATYGADGTASKGTAIDPGGTADTKGSWVEITASSDFEIRQLLINFGNNDNFVLIAATWLVDLAVGAAGSEQIVIADMFLGSSAGLDLPTPPNCIFEAQIPAATRIAMRAQCSITNAADRVFDTILHGLG